MEGFLFWFNAGTERCGAVRGRTKVGNPRKRVGRGFRSVVRRARGTDGMPKARERSMDGSECLRRKSWHEEKNKKTYICRDYFFSLHRVLGVKLEFVVS